MEIPDDRFPISRFAVWMNGSMDTSQLALGLNQRDAGLQPDEDADEHTVLAGLEVRTQQNPGLSLRGVETESLGHDAEHRTRRLIERNALADDGGVGA